MEPESKKPGELTLEMKMTLLTRFTDSYRVVLGGHSTRQQKTVKSTRARGGIAHAFTWPQPDLANRVSA